jgi:hypothetical protein
MSIQSEINRIINAVSAAHEKVSEKGGTTARPYLVENLEGAIDTIPIGVQLPTLVNPGKASDALSGKEFIDGSGNKITGTIATKTASNLSASGATVTVPAGYYASQATKSVATATQATPSISVSSAGLITASTTQTAGYVATGTKSATKQLTTQGAQTITPGTADKTIASGRYLTGTQTIKGDANLVAGNIKSGVSIFGVAGSMKTGADLNFEVVGGTARPSNPKENTIWINTSTSITEWAFSAEEPVSPTPGMVWIASGKSSMYEFNVLKKNCVNVYPLRVYQYAEAAWGEKPAEIYKNSAWMEFKNNLDVLRDGAIANEAGTYVAVSGTSFGNGVITSDKIDTTNGSYGHFSKKIDVSNFNTLTFRFSRAALYSTNMLCVGLATSEMTDTDVYSNFDKFIAYKMINENAAQTVEIDISGLDGLYYIAVAAIAIFTIDQIVLTR